MFTTLLMFSLSTAHMAIVIEYAFAQYVDGDAARQGETVLQRRGDPRVYVPTVLEIIDVSRTFSFNITKRHTLTWMIPTMQCYIGDAIVIWRAWVLWGKSAKALTIPGLLWLASVGMSMLTCILNSSY